MAETFFLSGTDMRAGNGRINSRRRYMSVSSAAGSFEVTAGKTIDIGRLPTGNGSLPNLGPTGFVWSVGTSRIYTQATVPSTTISVNGTFQSSTTSVIVS